MQILKSPRSIIAMSITLHYNSTCGDCARKAQQTAKLDWLNRVRISTEDSPIGEVPRGVIVVVEDETQKIYTGVYATRMICMQVPAYFLYGPALFIPVIRNIADKGKQGCNGDACEIPESSG